MTAPEPLLTAQLDAPQLVLLSDIEPPEHDGSINATEAAMLKLGAQTSIRLRVIPMTEKSPYRYRVVDGRRRYRAAVSMGLERMSAIIRREDDATSALNTIALNLGRTGNLLSEARAIRSLLDRGYDYAAIARESGVKLQRVQAIVPLCTLPEDVLEGVSQGRLSAATAKTVAKLPEQQRERALKAYRELPQDQRFTADKLRAARVSDVSLEETEQAMTFDAALQTGGAQLFDPLETTTARVRSLAKAQGVSVKELAQRLLEDAE